MPAVIADLTRRAVEGNPFEIQTEVRGSESPLPKSLPIQQTIINRVHHAACGVGDRLSVPLDRWNGVCIKAKNFLPGRDETEKVKEALKHSQ
jgi:hypothetical protein